MIDLKKFEEFGYDVFKGSIKNSANKNLFKNLADFCKFYCPSFFNQSYKNFWSDKKFNKQLALLRKKNKKIFSAIYNSFARSSALYDFCYSNNLHKLGASILGVNEKHIGIRDPILRMDVPNDKRNTYGWHQDSAYSKLHKNPKNEVVFWIPLINTSIKNGTLIVKPKSHNITGNVSYLNKKGGKLISKQYVIDRKYLNKFKSKSVNVKANNVLASYANLFHKSGNNVSNQIRFTVIVRFYKILIADYVEYRRHTKDLIALKNSNY